MSTTKLKEKILKRIEGLNDTHLLEEIMAILELDSDSDVLDIPKHYEHRLGKSILQKVEGNTVPNKEVEQRIEKWLYK